MAAFAWRSPLVYPMMDAHKTWLNPQLILNRFKNSMTALQKPPKWPCTQTPKHTTRTWDLVTASYQQMNPNSHHAFWWQATGVPLAILLEKAGYTAEAQHQNLLLYYFTVVPELGPGPDSHGRPMYWKSFMTDHSSPVELSWEWNLNDGFPTIRFSFEPISLCAGSSIDPFNAYAAERFVRQNHSTIPGCDLRWFDHFSGRLLSFKSLSTTESADMKGQLHQSRIFLALDLNKNGPMLKAYIMPVFAALEAGHPLFSVISEAIESLPMASVSLLSSYKRLNTFLERYPEGQSLQPEIISIDCIASDVSRVKIYMRSQCTSFDQVRRIMLLGDKSGQYVSPHGIHELCKFWKLIFGLQGNSPLDQELKAVHHRTSGVLYYFELHSEKSIPRVKVYLPVRHYGESDLCTAERLEEYFGTLGKPDLASGYIEALKGIVPEPQLRSQRGVQTYLACSIVGDGLKITSYLSPFVFTSFA